jgi:hypothetical protein
VSVRGADCDDPVRPRHLEFEVSVVWDGHELSVAWAPQDGMVRATEPHYLKGERFSPVVEGVTEGNGQIDPPHRHRTFP